MSDNSAIEWTDSTWGPVLGCSKVSEGCRNCYAIRTSNRMAHLPHTAATYEGLVARIGENGPLNWTGVVRCLPERLSIPLGWRKPRRIFVNSQSDLFHETVPDEFIDQVFAVMALTPRHTYQVLTKRPERMARYMTVLRDQQERLLAAARTLEYALEFEGKRLFDWPLPNVLPGTSTEDQASANQRIPHLLATPAAFGRMVSAEPLLGPLDLSEWLVGRPCPEHDTAFGFCGRTARGWCLSRPRPISWVIAGGESGGCAARPMHPDWARSLRDQCQEAGVAYFMKQWGNWQPVDQSNETVPGRPREHIWDDGTTALHLGKKRAGRLLDGRTWDEFPRIGGAVA